MVVLCCFLLFTSCSVYMAAKKEGVSIDEIEACKTRGCILAKGAELISSERTPDGGLIETYKCLHKKGSTGRAVMHGVLDVATLGLWEVAGTPIEGSKSKKNYFSVKIYYDKDEKIKKVELQ